MPNATLQFQVDARSGHDFTASWQQPKPYGYNLISISNTSAAALEIPIPSTVSNLQSELTLGEAYYLKTYVRGTVATWSSHFDEHREDDELWAKYKNADFRYSDDFDGGDHFGMLYIGTATNSYASEWNDSWIF